MEKSLPFKPAPKLQEAPAPNPAEPLNPPPHAVGPEKSLLSSMLQDPQEYIGRAIEKSLTPGHFYVPAHGTFFEILTEHFEAGKEVELVSLTQHLMDRKLLQSLGGPGAITEIYSYAPTAAHFDAHLEIVKNKHILRTLIHSCTGTITGAYEEPEDVQEFLDSAEQSILDIRDAAEVQKETSLKLTVKEVMEQFEDYLAGNRGVTGIKTGYPDLDKKCNGLKPGEIFIIAARPSMGKTSFMMNIVEHAAVDSEHPTLVFSCEMSAASLVQRLVFSRAKFDYSSLQDGYKTTKQDLSKIQQAARQIAASKLFIDDTAAITINELRAKARRKKRDNDIQLIAVDYLQLMRSLSKQASNSREREIAEISAGLKALAKELNIPVIVLAQLNRGPETRTGANQGKPRMSDLRESGSIEQDADLVGLLYRKSYYQKGTEEDEAPGDEGEAQLDLVKNRNGPTGDIHLTFIDKLMRFESASHRQEPQG